MPIGAHVSAAGSLDLSVDRASLMGAQTVQFFISPPQRWDQPNHSQEIFKLFKDKLGESSIESSFIHGTYLINLATSNPDNLKKSIDWLIYALNMAGELGVKGVIFHTGSHGGVGFEKVVDQIVRSVSAILKRCEGPQYLILENSAGAGGSIGSKFSELGQILKQVKATRVKICLDTCHLFASGYDVKTSMGLRSTIEEFEEEVGLENLVAIHANDCKFDLGSNKDRHENIGEGFIGKEGFKNIVNHPELKDIPFILEVPGFTNSGPDQENIQILKSLLDSKNIS